MIRSVRYTKRVMDIVLSLMVLLITFVPMVVIAILIVLDSKGPPLYFQRRALAHSPVSFKNLDKPSGSFNIIKFRTMVVNAESDIGAVNASENDSRVTRLGRFLRKYRIDEIPNFINVLLGHMSVVGPRADRFEIYDQVCKDFPLIYQRNRYVKPGITGMAQIQLMSNGDMPDNAELSKVVPEYELSAETLSFRFKQYYDAAYIIKLSSFSSFLLTDILILLKTPYVIVFRQTTI